MTIPSAFSEKASAVQHPLFSASPALREALGRNLQIRRFAHNERVFSHGDSASRLWLVISGWIKLSRQTPDGKETIAGLCAPGISLGEAALFANAHYPYNAETLGKQVELVSIAASDIRSQAEKDKQLSVHIMSMLSERNRQTQLKLEHMSTMSAAQRLGCFLLRLCPARAGDKQTTLHIPVEKNVLASYLGMKPETLSRSQQQLKPLGIHIQGERVEIEKVERLREFVCGSCSESGMGSCDAEN